MGSQFAEWIDGYKTYLTVGAILIVGALEASGVTIPVYVWSALGAAGLGFIRMAVAKAEL